MQQFIFGRLVDGTVASTGRTFSFVEVSDGFTAFNLNYDSNLKEQLNALSRGDSFRGNVTVHAGYKGLSATLVEVDTNY